MRKRSAIQQIMAMTLCLVLVIGAIPVSALAQNTGADYEPKAAALHDESSLLGSSLASTMLKSLASGAMSSLGEYGMEKALEGIFGKEADAVALAFEELKGEIGAIKSQLEDLSAKVDIAALRSNLNNYGAFIGKYAGVYDSFCSIYEACAKDPAMTQRFAKELYFGTDWNYMVEGNSVINATLNLGNELTRPLSGGYNIFGAFDTLDKYTNRWEHQGYEQRKAFRNSAICTYSLFSFMSQLACQAVLDSKESDEFERIKARDRKTALQQNAAKVEEMDARCAVKEHPDLRIYRDTKKGADLYVFYKQVQSARVYGTSDPEWANFTSTSTLGTKEFLLPIAKTSKFNREDDRYFKDVFSLYSQQPSITMYQRIYSDYKADNGGSGVDLYNIFFDQNRGGFTKPSDLTGRAKFATQTYLWKSISSFNGSWSTTLMNDQGQPKSCTLIDVYFHPTERVVSERLGEKVYSPYYYYGTVEQGKLMQPEDEPSPEPADRISGMASFYELPYMEQVVLTVEPKAGYTCQWHINTRDGGGYQKISGATDGSYTLPPLSAEMNGYQYICTFIPGSGGESPPEDIWADYLATAPVTLQLVGEGVLVPETEHAVSSVQELEAALERVSEGDWNGHTLRLTGDIEYPRPITLISRSLVIDTNGFTLSVNPSAASEPNVDPMSSSPEIAAIYVGSDAALMTNGGALNVQAGAGVAYGVYAVSESIAQVGSVTSSGGGIAVYVSNGGSVNVSGAIRAEGEDAVGTKCVDGGSVDVGGDVTIAGAYSCGAYIASSNGVSSKIEIDGNIAVSGRGSRGAYLDSEEAELTANGNVTVTGGAAGISAGLGTATVQGSVSAPDYAINAWNGAVVRVEGSVSVSEKNAVAIHSFGAAVNVNGDVSSAGSGGAGVIAAAWELSDPPAGAEVTVDGTISAATPLRIEGLSVEEGEYMEPSSKPGYRTYTDRTSTVWAKPGSFNIPVFYTLTVNAGGGVADGSGQYISGAEVSISAGFRSGYSFHGWHSDNGGSFANSNSSVTTFTMPAGNVTITARWLYIGDDSTGSDPSSGGNIRTAPIEALLGNAPNQPVRATAPVTATAGTDGFVNAAIPNRAVNEAIAEAQAAANAQGRAANGIAVELAVTLPKGATSLTTTLSRDSLNSLVVTGVSSLALTGSPVSLSLDLIALQEIREKSSGDISITIAPATGLSTEAKTLLGNRPVYNIDIRYVTDGKAVNVTTLGIGTATLSIPYIPERNEAVGSLFGVYVDTNGKAQHLLGSAYDPNSGSVIFTTTHLSLYGIGYTAPSAKFTDIPSHWGKESIDYVVGRGILSGTSNTTFEPDTAMTRGMLVTTLGRLADVNIKAYTTGSFTDVAADKYYTPYIEWAYKKGIVQGIGSQQFAPDRAVTREEIAVIFANYAKATGYPLPVAREATAYTDASHIGSTYNAAVAAMQHAGIMMGGSNNRFNPKSNATRVELSVMLHRYIKLTIDPATAQGWAKNDAGQWLYYKNAKPLIGWQTIDGVKYYFYATGALQTGWVKDDTGNWCFYFGNVRVIGWWDIGSGDAKRTHYFDTKGSMTAGKWLQIDEKWYYFNADGSLARNTIIDGYEVDENGVRTPK